MPKSLALTLLTILLLTALAGCTTGPPGGGDPPGPECPDDPPVLPPDNPGRDCEYIDFVTVDPGTLEGDLKAKLGGTPREAGMTVAEEAGYRYILVSAGRQPSSGYSLQIGSFLGYRDALVLHALLYTPAPGDTVLHVITYPSILIRSPADEREIILYLTDTRNVYLG